MLGNWPSQRNLWVTDTSNGAGKVRSRRPANPLPVGRRLFLVASWLSNQLSAPVNAASAEIYESGAWPRGACARAQVGYVPERPPRLLLDDVPWPTQKRRRLLTNMG